MIDNKILSVIILILVCWIGSVQPEVPDYIIDMLELSSIRVIILASLAWIATHNLRVAMLFSGLYLMVDHAVQQQLVAEHFVSELQYDGFSGDRLQEF